MSDSHGCHQYPKGQVLFFENANPNGIFVIYKGKVKVYKIGIDGKEQIVRLAGPGELLGYRSLISNENSKASAEALEETVACFVPRDTLFDFMRTNPQISLKMMELLAKDLRAAEERITHLAQDSVRERLAQTLLLLKENFGVREDKKTLNIILTREDLANIVGTATETVIRLLSDFKKDNLIDLFEKKIILLDERKLAKTANVFD